jgi:CubicO group peptidase (beta-lactamase class C family)
MASLLPSRQSAIPAVPEQAPPRDSATTAPANAVGRWWHLGTALLLVVLWIGLGVVIPLDAAGFVFLGAVLVVVFQLVRRRPPRRLLARDGSDLTRSRTGKAALGAALLVIPAFLTVRYMASWVDDSWIVLLTLGVLSVGYLILRRTAVVLILAALVVAVTVWAQAPQLSTSRSGDAALLAQLDGLSAMGGLDGFEDPTVAKVDLGASQPVRVAGIGATATTPMEIGSLTKALTGLIIADSIERGELRLDAPVATYLPQLRGSAAGGVTMRELVTHRSGYAEFGAATFRRAVWMSPLGRNWIDTDLTRTMREVRSGDLASRGSYSYSTLGTATAGQAAAAAAGMSYPDLMRTRLFAPLGMLDTAVQTREGLVPGGQTRSGLSEQPWVFDAYAPGGAVVSTAKDLTLLATALLDGTAPGINALTPIAVTDANNNSRIGEFWRVSHWQTGQTITWHNGQTAGYTSYLGLDRQHRTAVIVVSDVALDPNTTDLGANLLAQQP